MYAQQQPRPRESQQQHHHVKHESQQVSVTENIKIRQEETSQWISQGIPDSGISTGVNTASHSVISGRSNPNNEGIQHTMSEHDSETVLANVLPSASSSNNPYETWGSPGIGHQQLQPEDLDVMNQQLAMSRTQRVRQAMFPESLDEGTAIASTQFDDRKPTTVQQLAEPSQMLKTAVSNLIHYQDDTDLATRAIPELIKLLNDDDQVVVCQAAMIVHQLSKKDASRYALMQSPQMLNTLVKALNNARDEDTIKAAVGVLQNMSRHEQGRLAIFKSEGIKALVKLLDERTESIVFFAITSIHNLLLYQDGSKLAVRLAGGIPKMCKLLTKNNVTFLAILTDCLQILAVKNQEAKLIILASGGPQHLVRIMSMACPPGAERKSYEKMFYTTCRVLKVLSVCPNNKPTIIAEGGVHALSHHLSSESQKLVLNCLWTLRNLSDAATKQSNLDQLLHALIQLLGSRDLQIVTCSAGILSNLTCNNSYNKQFLTRDGGVEALIKAIREHSDKEEVTEPAVCALRHLTGKHPPTDDIARKNVYLNYGIGVVVELLQHQTRWPLTKAVIGLIRNLAICQQNRAPLREQGAIGLLIQRMMDACNLLSEQQRGSLGSMTSTDGVRMEEIIEGTASALSWMSKQDLRSRIMIREADRVIQTLVYLIDSHDETVVKAVVSLLGELAEDREGAMFIEAEGATEPLSRLLNSGNGQIAAYAARVMLEMSKDKPQDYQKRLSMDLNSMLPHWSTGGNDMDLMSDGGYNGDTMICHMNSGGPPSVRSQASSHQNPYGNAFDPNGMSDPYGMLPGYGQVGGGMPMDIGQDAMDFEHGLPQQQILQNQHQQPLQQQGQQMPWYQSPL